ncbi:MAG: ABC transporter permease, partial [Nitrospirota bacterium]|nr:ABC transporter permease [Nitrospirota bacterium]
MAEAETVLDPPESADAISVAPNWKLVWWRFTKHRLAVISGVIVICIAIVALFPGFFSTQDPNESAAKGSFIPVQRVHFWDDGPSLFVYGVAGARNPKTLRMEWQIDQSRKIPLRLFARGYPWKALRLISTDIHLIGLADPDADPAFHLLGTDRLGRDQWSR